MIFFETQFCQKNKNILFQSRKLFKKETIKLAAAAENGVEFLLKRFYCLDNYFYIFLHFIILYEHSFENICSKDLLKNLQIKKKVFLKLKFHRSIFHSTFNIQTYFFILSGVSCFNSIIIVGK